MHDIFCFTDIHGMYSLFSAIINYCNEQDPDAMIIFCGDACDRGPDGYKIMKELLDNWHIVYLKGNHEDLFVKAAKEIKSHFVFNNMNHEQVYEKLNNCIYCDDKYLDIQNAIFNGGIETLTDWVVDGMSMEFVDKIEHLPLTFSTDTCDFCHSAGPYSIFKRVADAEYNVEKIDPVDAEALVWTRTMLNMGWAQNRTVVFGHTPVLYLDDYIKVEWNEDEDIHPYKWNPGSGGTKIDMDTGAAFSNCAYVLNVLTMRAQGFEEKVPFEVKKIDCIQM